MFSILKTLKGEFDRGVDEAKLIDFKNRVKSANGDKIVEFTKEIHFIMQRHYTNKDILNECKDLLKYIEKIIKLREEMQNIKIYGYSNSCVTKNFATVWDY